MSQERPHTPYNERLFAAAMHSLRGRAPAEMVIGHHITVAGPFNPLPAVLVNALNQIRRQPWPAGGDMVVRANVE